MEALDPDRASALEQDFRERVTSRLDDARSFQDPLSGRAFDGRARRDESLRGDFEPELSRLARSNRVHDDVLLDRLPRGWRARWEIQSGALLLRRCVCVVEAAVVHPFADLLSGLLCTPTPREAALAALTPDPEEGVPRVGLVLATSGWNDGELADLEGTTLFLVEPAPGGGYKLAAGSRDALPGYLALESREELMARVAEHVRASRVDLVLRGLELRRTSERTGAPVEVVEQAFRTLARADEFLRLAVEEDTLVLRRA